MKRFVIAGLALGMFCVHAHAQNLPSVYARSDAPYSVLSASGKIFAVDGRTNRVFLDSAKPFWAPGPNGDSRITLWPTKVLLCVSVSIGTHITIDGKKGSLSDLLADRKATIQYMMSVNYNVSSTVRCFATKIDVHTAAQPAKKGQPNKSAGRTKK